MDEFKRGFLVMYEAIVGGRTVTADSARNVDVARCPSCAARVYSRANPHGLGRHFAHYANQSCTPYAPVVVGSHSIFVLINFLMFNGQPLDAVLLESSANLCKLPRTGVVHMALGGALFGITVRSSYGQILLPRHDQFRRTNNSIIGKKSNISGVYVVAVRKASLNRRDGYYKYFHDILAHFLKSILESWEYEGWLYYSVKIDIASDIHKFVIEKNYSKIEDALFQYETPLETPLEEPLETAPEGESCPQDATTREQRWLSLATRLATKYSCFRSLSDVLEEDSLLHALKQEIGHGKHH